MTTEESEIERPTSVEVPNTNRSIVKTESKEEFNFPFKPYDIQVQLMRAAYEAFEDRKFALLESPTGTGKSLSLICSSLTWLREHQTKLKQQLKGEKKTLEDEIEKLKIEEEQGDWLSAQTRQRNVIRKLDEVNEKLDKILKSEQRSESRRHAMIHDVPIDDHAQIDHGNKTAKKDEVSDKNILGSQGSQLSEDDVDINENVKQEQEDHVRPKVYFASRTHSQLSQFIREVKRTKFAESNDAIPIKVAPLASRANLCVNHDVLKLRDPSAINERCMEMQKETSKEKRCPYAKASQINRLKEDILASVQDIEDIASRGRIMGSCAYYAARMAIPEAEIVVLPYNNLLHHETRKANALDLNDSIVIFDEAHNILETICSIHSASITGQHLIAAHTIISRYYRKYHTRMSPKNASTIYTIVKCITALIRFLNQPQRHLDDYERPVTVKLDESITEAARENCKANSDQKQTVKQNEMMIDINKFIGAANVAQFNIYKLIDYFNRSQLARKLLGSIHQDNSLDLSIELYGLQGDVGKATKTSEKSYSDTPAKKRSKKGTLARNQAANKHNEVISVTDSTKLEFLKESNSQLRKSECIMTSYPVYILIEFLRALTNFSNDGKLLVSHIPGEIQQSSLKFVLLNPSGQFRQMTEQARSIVLAGGTMQPFSEFEELLFEPLGVDRDRLKLFSCGHVVRPDQVYVSTLSSGPTGKPLELSYKTRSSFEMIDEIGRTLLTIATSVPGGVVCFLPSYDYEQFCFNRWTQIGIIRNIETKAKQIFREPRKANHLRPILDDYSRTVEKSKAKGRGALLFCVVGGKMSEGINFNDDLGRCIVMIGLPYANIKSSELQQKIAYYDNTCKRSQGVGRQQISAGQQYYESLCVKGVNQSIGRAIRHREDYAAIILLDQRYSSKTTIREGLPAWLRQSLVNHDRFGPMITSLRQFFKDK